MGNGMEGHGECYTCAYFILVLWPCIGLFLVITSLHHVLYHASKAGWWKIIFRPCRSRGAFSIPSFFCSGRCASSVLRSLYIKRHKIISGTSHFWSCNPKFYYCIYPG